MEKVIKLSLILMLIMICVTSTVYATSSTTKTPSCSITLETAKSEFSKNEEFNVDVKISKIESERGFIALEATLDYDKDSLTLVDMEGQNKWTTPVKDLSYNEATGKLVIDKSGLAKSDEVILKLKFKVKENSKENAMIALKDISVSDATVPAKISVASKNITIKEGQNTTTPDPTPTPTPEPTPTPTPTPTPNPDNSQTQTPTINNGGNSNNKPAVKIPQAGENNIVLMILATGAVVAVIMGAVFFVKMRK